MTAFGCRFWTSIGGNSNCLLLTRLSEHGGSAVEAAGGPERVAAAAAMLQILFFVFLLIYTSSFFLKGYRVSTEKSVCLALAPFRPTVAPLLFIGLCIVRLSSTR